MHILQDETLYAFDLLRCVFSSPPKLLSVKHSSRLYKSSILTLRGSQRLHILEFALNLTQTSIFLSMPVLSTIVQKGGDCKSKSFAPMSFGYFWPKQSRN